MLERATRSERWQEVIEHVYSVVRRVSGDRRRNYGERPNAAIIGACTHGTHRSEEVRMTLTASIQCLGGNVDVRGPEAMLVEPCPNLLII